MAFVGRLLSIQLTPRGIPANDARCSGLRYVSPNKRSGSVTLRAQAEADAPKPTLAEVQAMVTSEDLGQRASGVNRARYLEPKDCLEVLLAAVKDENPQVRYAAVSQLAEAGHVDPERTFPIVTELLVGDAESSVRAGAADVITTLKMPECFDVLSQVYNESTDWMLKFSIVSGLGELADARAYDLLIEALESSEPLLQMGALGSLGELGDSRAIEVVEPFLESEDTSLSERAKIAMTQLKAQV